METAAVLALVAELAKRTGVCWLRYDGTDHPVWHVWRGGALLVVSGGDEQPLPGIDQHGQVEVVMRSKSTGGRLVTWRGETQSLEPGSTEWDEAAHALASERISIASLTLTPVRWARHSRITRIVPTGDASVDP